MFQGAAVSSNSQNRTIDRISNDKGVSNVLPKQNRTLTKESIVQSHQPLAQNTAADGTKSEF